MGEDGRQVNYVHEAENWRQRIRYENDSSKTFEDKWGFLKGKKDDEPTAYSTKLAKYFNPQGGTWTVRQKRIPFMFEQKKDQEEESLGTGALHIAKEARGRSARSASPSCSSRRRTR